MLKIEENNKLFMILFMFLVLFESLKKVFEFEESSFLPEWIEFVSRDSAGLIVSLDFAVVFGYHVVV